MGMLWVVALAAAATGVAVAAAAWDRSHGRKNETWEDWRTLPAWTYPFLVVLAAVMIASNLADGNWIGVAGTVVLAAAVSVTQYSRRQRT